MTHDAALTTGARPASRLALAFERPVVVSAVVLVFSAVCALLLALPGQTVTTRYLNDLFLILDHTHRVVWGHVPSQDFHTALGPLASYVPAAGYWVSGSLGGAMPLGMALVIVALAPAIAHILASRLQPVVAFFYGAFLVAVLAAPINLGEPVTALSFAKFYNRIGWVALGALLILYLPRGHAHRGSDCLDAVCAALLTLVMIYTKATYGLVGSAFLLFMLFDRSQCRWAAGAIGLVLAVALVVESVWRSSLAYIADLRFALEINGAVRGTWGQIMDHVLGNFADYVVFALLSALALRLTGTVRDVLFYSQCAVAGFLVINQNFQAWGIISLHAGGAVAAEMILRHTKDRGVTTEWQALSTAAGAKLLFIAFVLPTIAHCAIALGLHAIAASSRAGDSIGFAKLEKVRFANLWSGGDHEAGLAYLATIKDGAAALSAMSSLPECVVSLDFANPFSAILGLRPPRGDAPWLQWGRTITASTYLPAERMLSAAQIVIEPKPPAENDAAAAFEPGSSPRAVYGPYLAANFDVVRETGFWIVHRRRPPEEGTASAYCRETGTPSNLTPASRPCR